MAIAIIRLFLKSQLLDQRVWLDLHSGIGLGSMSPQQHQSVKHFSWKKLGYIPTLFPLHGGLPSKSLQRVYICIIYIYIDTYIEPAGRVSPLHPQTKTNSEDELRRRIPRRQIAPRRRIPPERRGLIYIYSSHTSL